ncbi:MAG TPA: GFA family protein [Dongiaceae bacterium]|nr:GFA family protein [Dongiaceae bacterium]
MADDTMRYGRCFCGDVRYRVIGEPIWVSHCHCESCRRATSAAFASFAGFERGRFEIIAGDPAIHRSSPGVERRFCRRCGSQLTYEGARWPTETHILLCSLEDPGEFTPTAHVHTDEQLPWVHLADGLPRRAG